MIVGGQCLEPWSLRQIIPCGLFRIPTRDPGIHLLKSMGDSAKLLKDNPTYSDNKDLQFVYGEILNRIEQVGHGSHRKEPQIIWDTAKSVLASLNEPDSDKRQ
ncbi:hypothetical protein ACFLYF_00900 [Chloroflexota bacterium]